MKEKVVGAFGVVEQVKGNMGLPIFSPMVDVEYHGGTPGVVVNQLVVVEGGKGTRVSMSGEVFGDDLCDMAGVDKWT
jgi:hypothetical protein